MPPEGKAARDFIANEVTVGSGTEDELSSSFRLPRVTPRNSTPENGLETSFMQTPYANLRHLAGIIQKPYTPLRGASNGKPTTTGRKSASSPKPIPIHSFATFKTQQLSSAKRGPHTTPHGARALQRRAAALTPGRDRRRSGRMQRETPRDALRNLSRVLAPTTHPVEHRKSSPQENSAQSAQSEDDELGDDLPTPRMSLAFGEKVAEEDDDSFHLLPPRLSLPLEDGRHTRTSVEMGRRAYSERPTGRRSGGSYDGMRMSDRFSDMNELQLDPISEDQEDGSTLHSKRDGFEDDIGDFEEYVDQSGDLQDLQRAMLEEYAHRQGRASDVRSRQSLQNGVDKTFAFDIPSTHPEDSSLSNGSMCEHEDPGSTRLDLLTVDLETNKRKRKAKASVSRVLRISRHGNSYPSLPAGVVKNIASALARLSGDKKSKFETERFDAIKQASEWFFEQISEDLGTYSKHAGRRKINESDVITLMKRQRQSTATATSFSLAQEYLPRELLQDIRMTPLQKSRKRRRYCSGIAVEKLAEEVEEEFEEEDEVDKAEEEETEEEEAEEDVL